MQAATMQILFKIIVTLAQTHLEAPHGNLQVIQLVIKVTQCHYKVIWQPRIEPRGNVGLIFSDL